MNNARRTLLAIQEVLLPYNIKADAAEHLLSLYVKAVDGFDIELIERAASMFTLGQVPDHDGRFRPTPAMVAKACRFAAAERARTQRLAVLAQPRLPSPPRKKCPQSKARVRQMVDEYVRTH